MPTANSVDVSKWQSPESMDWDSLKKDGLKSVIIQLSHGTSEEPKAAEFLTKVRSEGLIPHGYHFYQGSTSEFAFATQNAQKLGLKRGAYFFLDMEGDIAGDWAQQFEQFRIAVQAAGYKPGLYISDSPYKARFNNQALVNAGVARWIASYSYEPKNYDIWQFSNGNGKLDHDFDRAGILSFDYTNTTTPPVNPPNAGTIRAYVLDWGYDTDTGVYGRGCSFDGGKTFKVYYTMYGRKFYQEDGDRIWPFLKDKVAKAMKGSVLISWSDITDKPNFVTKDELDERLSNFKPSGESVSWDEITGKPNLATEDELKNIQLTPGRDGKSAYQIAVDHGFVGSEEEWLQSLHGKDGSSSSGGDTSLSIEAITDLIKQHIHAVVNTQDGQLTVSVDDTDNGSIADAVAAKVASTMSWKMDTNGELIAQLGGE